MNEETKDPENTPGRAATITVVTIVALYLLLAISMIMFAGVGDGECGRGNPDIQDNAFFALADGGVPRPGAVRIVRPIDGGDQGLVGDGRVGLNGFTGGGVHHCIAAHY